MLLLSCEPSRHIITPDPRVDQLQKENANVLNQLNDCNTQVKKINEEKTSLQNQCDLVQKDLKVLSFESKLTIADQATRLKNLNSLLKTQNGVMTTLLKSIVDALVNFKTDELNSYIKEGKVYVTLEEKLLFKSGSDVVNPKGKEALKSLALVINGIKDITVAIEGYTDNIPIKNKIFEDNWDLSTARATSIVRILTKDFGFDSNRITASGRGQYHPLKTNETTIGRAANRRTEIIISPDLKELYTLLNL